MSADRDVTRIVRSWLREDGNENAERVLFAVVDQLDTTPQRRANWLARRFPFMNSTTVRWALAAAAAALVLAVGIRLLPGANIGGGPTPTPTPSIPAFNDVPDGATLAPGTYVIDGMPVGVTLTVPAGWDVAGHGGPVGAGLRKVEGIEVLLAFWVVDGVYDDACNAATLREVGPTVDELADGLAAMSSVDASAPTAVSVGGFAGRHLTLQRAVECDGSYYLWETPEPGIGRADVGQGDPATDEVWVLNVDGTRLVIGIHSYASADAADLAEARDIVSSIVFDAGT
jgi:hypothetical protein